MTPPLTTPVGRVRPERLAVGARQRRDYPATIDRKATETADDRQGVLTGYASVFGVIDSYGDVIMPGAFARTIAAWQAKGRPVPILWQHDTHAPIGVSTTLSEDEAGLRLEATLLVADVAQAREAAALADAGALGGLSIGFSIPAKTSSGGEAVTYDPTLDAWLIHEVKLWEVSLVTFPANELATIDAIKAAEAAAASMAAFTAAVTSAAEQVRALAASIRERADSVAPVATVTEAAPAGLLREAARLIREIEP